MGIYSPASTPSYGAAPARPAAKTWQEQQQYDAQDAWKQQGSSVYGDQSSARDTASTYRAGADSAASTFAGGQPAAVAAWKPMAAGPSQLDKWLGSAPAFAGGGGGGGGGAGGVGSVGLPGGGGGGAAPSGQALSRFDPKALEDFDPAAYGKDYAKGAYGQFQTDLGDQLSQLERSSAGTGRLKTGFYTGDQGRTVERLGGQFEDKLSQAATTFSGQRLSALQGGEQLRYQRAAGIDADALTASAQADARAQASASNNLRATEDQNNFALDRWKTGLNAAGSADELAYRGTADRNAQTYGQAQFQDTMGYNTRKGGLDAALAREQEYNGLAGKANDRADSYTSSTREWAANDRDSQDSRDEAERLRRMNDPGYGRGGSWSTGGGVTRTTPMKIGMFGIPVPA